MTKPFILYRQKIHIEDKSNFSKHEQHMKDCYIRRGDEQRKFMWGESTHIIF